MTSEVAYYQFSSLFEPSLEVDVKPSNKSHKALNTLTKIHDALKKGTFVNNTNEKMNEVVDKIYKGFKAKYDRQASSCCLIASCCLPCLFDNERYQVDKLYVEISHLLSSSKSCELTTR